MMYTQVFSNVPFVITFTFKLTSLGWGRKKYLILKQVNFISTDY